MKHVDGWEDKGETVGTVVDKGEQQGDCGTFCVPICIQNLLFLSVLSVLSYGRLVVTGVDLC